MLFPIFFQTYSKNAKNGLVAYGDPFIPVSLLVLLTWAKLVDRHSERSNMITFEEYLSMYAEEVWVWKSESLHEFVPSTPDGMGIFDFQKFFALGKGRF